MADEALQSRVLRFGTFELDLSAGELRKNGRKVRLQEQPFQLLAALLERPGQVVTRDELRDKLWPADTYVDFDQSLNTAASKLREALGDSASSPRFMETLPRRGYRFLASVEPIGNAHDDELLPSHVADRDQSAAESATSELESRLRNQRIYSAVAVAGLLIVIAVLWQRSAGPVGELPLRRFSFRPGKYVDNAMISPDGRHIAYVSGQSLWIQDLDREEPRLLVEGGVRGRGARLVSG